MHDVNIQNCAQCAEQGTMGILPALVCGSVSWLGCLGLRGRGAAASAQLTAQTRALPRSWSSSASWPPPVAPWNRQKVLQSRLS